MTPDAHAGKAEEADVTAYKPTFRRRRARVVHPGRQSVALGFMSASEAGQNRGAEFETIGFMRPVLIVTTPTFDPERERMRG